MAASLSLTACDTRGNRRAVVCRFRLAGNGGGQRGRRGQERDESAVPKSSDEAYHDEHPKLAYTAIL
jgi:hypothetical protein